MKKQQKICLIVLGVLIIVGGIGTLLVNAGIIPNLFSEVHFGKHDCCSCCGESAEVCIAMCCPCK